MRDAWSRGYETMLHSLWGPLKNNEKESSKVFFNSSGTVGGFKKSQTVGAKFVAPGIAMQKKRRIREGNGNCFVVVFFVYKDVGYEGNANTLHTDLFSWQKKKR